MTGSLKSTEISGHNLQWICFNKSMFSGLGSSTVKKVLPQFIASLLSDPKRSLARSSREAIISSEIRDVSFAHICFAPLTHTLI